MAQQRRAAQARRQARQFLQDVDRAPRLAREFEAKSAANAAAKQEKTAMAALRREQEVPAILHGGKAIYPWAERAEGTLNEQCGAAEGRCAAGR